LLLCALGVGCSERGSGKDVTFSGTLLSSPVQLIALDGEGRELVSVLREEGSVVSLGSDSLLPLAAPAGCTSPLVVETAALDDEQRDDLLILDSSCDGWAVLRQADGWQSSPWGEQMPEVPPGDNLAFRDLNGDGRSDLASSTAFGISGFLRGTAEGAERWVAFEESFPPPNVNRMMVNNLMIDARWRDEPVVLFQTFGALQVLRLSSLDLPSVELPQTELELLKPFDGFDQLTAVAEMPSCDVAGVGAGYFADSARAPKPLVSLRLLDDAFVARRIRTELSQVVAVAKLDVAEVEYLGAIEGSAAGFGFELLERVGCDTFESRAFQEIEFDVPGVVGVAETPEQLAASSGEWLVAGKADQNLTFSHFDGRKLRRFVVELSSGSIHEEARAY
jgi:hypothetical protein